MSDSVVVALITVVGGIVAAIITAVLSQRKPVPPHPVHVSLTDRDHVNEQVVLSDQINKPRVAVKPGAPTAIPSTTQSHHQPQANGLNGKGGLADVNPSNEVLRAVTLHDPSQIRTLLNGSCGDIEEMTLGGDVWRDHHLEKLAQFVGVRHLKLMACSKIGDVGLAYISKMNGLRELEFIPGCGDRVTEAGIRALARLNNLEVLKLMFTKFNPKLKHGVDYLQRSIPGCAIG